MTRLLCLLGLHRPGPREVVWDQASLRQHPPVERGWVERHCTRCGRLLSRAGVTRGLW